MRKRLLHNAAYELDTHKVSTEREVTTGHWYAHNIFDCELPIQAQASVPVLEISILETGSRTRSLQLDMRILYVLMLTFVSFDFVDWHAEGNARCRIPEPAEVRQLPAREHRTSRTPVCTTIPGLSTDLIGFALHKIGFWHVKSIHGCRRASCDDWNHLLCIIIYSPRYLCIIIDSLSSSPIFIM